MPTEMFIVRNRITLQAAILDCSEVFSEQSVFSPENTGGRVLLLIKLWTDCSD